MKTCFLILVSFFFIQTAFSQSKAVRFSAGAIIADPLNPKSEQTKDWRVPTFELAYQYITKKEHYHHIGLYGFYFGNNEKVNTGEIKEYGYGFRYTYAFKTVSFFDIFDFYIGPSAVLHARFSEFEPNTTIFFPVEQNNTEFILGCIPTLQFQLNDKLFIHAGIPLSLIAFTQEYNRTRNPAFTIRQQEHRGNSIELLSGSRFEFEVGFGARF